ncbi:MAG: PDZ domain-containing protein [Lachnospiraceae bacterium]|nr:PDZ domain-containing protein [Lachnospiraceae bacterium]
MHVDVSRTDRNYSQYPVVTNSLEVTDKSDSKTQNTSNTPVNTPALSKPTSTPTPKPQPTELVKNDSDSGNKVDNEKTEDKKQEDEKGTDNESNGVVSSDLIVKNDEDNQNVFSQDGSDEKNDDDYYEEEDKESFTKEALDRAYEIIKKAERDSKKSIVTVSNIHEEIVYLPSYNKITTKKDYFGVALFNTGNSLLLLTKYSNVKSSGRIEVDFGIGNSVAADLYSFDEMLDLCVVEVLTSRLTKEQSEHVTVAMLTTDEVNKYTVGSLAIAHEKYTGFKDMSFEGTITSVDNSKEIKDRVIDFFTLNTINYAKAEGFVFNLDGELLGMIDHSLEDESHQVTTVMSFDSMRWALSKLLSGDKISGLGVTVSNMSDVLRQKANAKTGVFVKEVDKNSNSFDYLVAGDILVAVNSLECSDVHAYVEIMSKFKAGDVVTLTLLREKFPGEYREEEYEIVVQ